MPHSSNFALSFLRDVVLFRGTMPAALVAAVSLCLFAPAGAAKKSAVGDGLWVEGTKKTRPIQIPSVAPLVKRTEPASLVVFTKTRVTEPMLPPGHPSVPGGGPEGGPEEVQGQGSGFLIHPSGLALTNAHVVENALALWVQVGTDPKEIAAKVIGVDEKTDVALLQLIDAERKKPWPVVPLGDSSKLEVGDFVVAIGNPFGLEQTVSMGILSARHRKNIAPSGRVGLYDFLQTDASINVGNSGGPLLNLRGEVVGINTAVNSAASGIGFAIPINMVKAMLPALKKDGKVARSWIGVQISPLSREVARGLGLDRPRGALVTRVLDTGPAAAAGIAVGDVVTRFGDVALEDATDLPLLAGNYGAGVPVELEVVRNKKPLKLTVTLGTLPEAAPEAVVPAKPKVEKEAKEKKKKRLGFFVSDLNAKDKERFNLNPDSNGVLIFRIQRGSPAAMAGLQKDDIIVGVNGERVTDAKTFQEKVKATKAKELLSIVVVRQGATVFVPLVMP